MSVHKALHKKAISVYTGQHIRGEYDLLEGIILHRPLEMYYFAHSMQVEALRGGVVKGERPCSHISGI